MSQVLVLTGDLMFGSQVQGSLSAAGNEVQLVADEERLRARLADEEAPRAHVLVADLTDERLDAAGIVASLKRAGELTALRTLAFYSHVDVAARERAESVGFDMVVPRSRMAREGAQLISRLA